MSFITPHITTLIAIASGSALGGVCRYLTVIFTQHITSHTESHGIPFGTLCVNIIGSLLMGILASTIAIKWQIPDTAKYFIMVGFLGSYTTFSAFSLDAVTLLERGATLSAALYVFASVALSLGALILGAALTRMALS